MEEILKLLQEVGLTPIKKGNKLTCLEVDSLSFQLTGEYQGWWTRWSNGARGVGLDSLLIYLGTEGIIDMDKVKRLNINTEEIYKDIKEVEVKPYDFSSMVRDEDTTTIEDYLVCTRKLSELTIKSLINKDYIIQDGYGSCKFLWRNPDQEIIGGEVHKISRELTGDGKIILGGSKGLFHILTEDITDYSEVKHIYLFEAAIDLISFLEMSGYVDDLRTLSSVDFPKAVLEKSILVSMSGAVTKLDSTLKALKQIYNVNIEEATYVVCTDNDEAGELVTQTVKEKYPTNPMVRMIPNRGLQFKGRNFKDWNDFLKAVKIDWGF